MQRPSLPYHVNISAGRYLDFGRQEQRNGLRHNRNAITAGRGQILVRNTARVLRRGHPYRFYNSRVRIHNIFFRNNPAGIRIQTLNRFP
nr:MAG TPA: hypothetical protein [Caudoviricetes sp.]